MSTNSAVYEALKTLRDEGFDRARGYAKLSHGKNYQEELKELIGRERWEANLKSARQLRTSRVLSIPLVDEFDAQDVTDLPRIFEKRYDAYVDLKGKKHELVSALNDIAMFRHGIAHPASAYVSTEDARRLAERIITAANIIFPVTSVSFKNIRSRTEALFDHKPTPSRPLAKSLPPRQEVLNQFIGREYELRTLHEWFQSPVQLWVLVGDGGKGKSSIAFIFCETLECAKGELEHIIWLSAKTRRFQEGEVRRLEPDFFDLESAFESLLRAYDSHGQSWTNLDEQEAYVIELLKAFPALIVIDDIDSLDRENENVAYWFTNTLARSAPQSKVILTSRRELYGLGAYTTKVAGLTQSETKRFLQNASERAYGDADKLTVGDLPKLIHNATEGSPLYLEDIVRLVLVLGKPPHEVIADWKKVRHDVREYALRRELEMLSQTSREVLLATALAGEPISRAELIATLGGSDDALESAISELQKFFLISPPDIASLTPTFEINRNLGILVKSLATVDSSFKRIANALAQVRNKGERPHNVSKDASRAIREAVALVGRDKHSEAEQLLRDFLIRYPDEGSLLSHLGWVLSRWPDGRRMTEAQEAMQRAVDLRHRNKATYHNLGGIYLSARLFERALSAVTVGVELYPDDLDLLTMYAEAQALAAIEVSERVDPASSIGVDSIVAPLSASIRMVISVKKKMISSEVPRHRNKAILDELDAELRQALDRIKRSR